jgi:hypothetical protein
MNLADRANLWFKIGNYTQVPIERGEETEIINLIAETETFADVLIAAEALYKYCKHKQEEETKISLDNLESQQSGANQQPASDFSDQQEGENDQQEQPGETDSYGGTAKQETTQKGVDHQDGGDEEPEVKNDGFFGRVSKDLVNTSGYENVYLELPKLDLNKSLFPIKRFMLRCKETWNKLS